MNNFMNYIQPTIVKLSDSEDLPTSLRNHYMINLNVVGIKYFTENFILGEGPTGEIVMKESYQEGDVVNGFAWLTEESLSEDDVIDIPRAYIVISEALIKDDSCLKEYIISGLIDNAVFGDGISGFRPGHDFYINDTLYKYLLKEQYIEENEDIVLPNYLTKAGVLSEYFEELTCNEKDYSNINYYFNKNKFADNTYPEDELRDFYANFANTILTFTQIDDEIRAELKNQVYDLVLNYFAHYKSDGASIALNLIMNTAFSNTNGPTGCGCATGASSCGTAASNNAGANSSLSPSCFELYQQAMDLYLKKMLGDPEFYRDWFTINIGGDNYIMNNTLVDALDTFIEEFKKLGLSLEKTGRQKYFTCGCASGTDVKTFNDYSKLDNFQKVLSFIKNCTVDANINKIKVYGEALGELLPNMQY